MTNQNPTTHDRVKQAITNDAEMQDKLASLLELVTKAKQEEDEVRKNDKLAQTQKELDERRDKAIGQAQAAYDTAIAKALIPLRAAEAIFKDAQLTTEATLNKVKDTATASHKADLATAKRQHDLTAATAQAKVYRAQQEVAAHRTTIDQSRRNVLERLGIDLNKMMGG